MKIPFIPATTNEAIKNTARVAMHNGHRIVSPTLAGSAVHNVPKRFLRVSLFTLLLCSAATFLPGVAQADNDTNAAGLLLAADPTLGASTSETGRVVSNIDFTAPSGESGNPFLDGAGVYRLFKEIDGDLTVTGNSDFSLLRQGVSGQPTQGSISVTGNLTLNAGSTIEAADLSSWYGPGLQNLYQYNENYQGGLQSGNTGALMVSSQKSSVNNSYSLQIGRTAVNLLVTPQSMPLVFWNGSNTTSTGGGSPEGGAGTWQEGSSNWTNADNTKSQGFDSKSAPFAIFEKNGDTVRVSGPVTVSGMQFSSLYSYEPNGKYVGYTLTAAAGTSGDSVILQGAPASKTGLSSAATDIATDSSNSPNNTGLLTNSSGNISVIRVGNGSDYSHASLPDYPGQLATIDLPVGEADHNNPTTLVKTDQGTLIFTANAKNTYTGGTVISNGTLQVNDDGNLGLDSNGKSKGDLAIVGGVLQAGAGGNGQGVTINAGRNIILADDNHGSAYKQIDLDGHTLNLNAPIIGPGSLAVGTIGNIDPASSAAVLNLKGENTYSGKTWINGPGDNGARSLTVNAYDEKPFGADNGSEVKIANNSIVNYYGSGAVSSNELGNHNVLLDNSQLNFYNNTNAANASVHIGTQGSSNATDPSVVDISHASGGVSIGLMDGSGNVHLGKNTLTIGGLTYTGTFSGVIDDNNGQGGGLTKISASGSNEVETLSGVNTYTGKTSIEGGTLALAGSGSIAKSSVVNVASGAVFDSSAAQNATDTGSSNGTSIQGLEGAGKATLGDTRLNITNAYDPDNQGQPATFGGVISGNNDSALSITGGTERLNYQGSQPSSTYTGSINIGGGNNTAALQVDGDQSWMTGPVSVGSNGILQGAGTIGGSNTQTVIENGGIVQAGDPNSHGNGQELIINGDLTLADGATTIIRGTDTSTTNQLKENDGTTYHQMQSDFINVGGKVSLGGNLRLDLLNVANNLKQGEGYRVMQAGKGFTGGLANQQSTSLLGTGDTSKYQYLNPEAMVSTVDGADYLDVVLKRSSYITGGQTRNEIGTGHALDHLPQGSALAGALNGLANGQGRQALNNLSGEVHASVRTALIQDSFYIRNAVMNRLSNTDCAFGRNGQSVYDMKTQRKNGACANDHVVLWGQAYGGLGHNGGSGGAATMQHNTAGFIMGMDAPIRGSNWRAGGLVSYGHSMLNIGDGRSSSANSNNITVGGYAGTHWGALNLRLGASYSWNTINTRRQIAVGGYGSRVNSSYLGGTAQSFAELGYRMRAGRTVFEPFMNVAYINMQTNGYRERGNDAALRGHGTDTGVTFSTFGFRMASRFNIGKMLFMPHLMGAYRHGFGQLGSRQKQGFALTGGNNAMETTGVLLSSNAAIIDTGLTARLNDRVDVDLSYIGQYGNQSTESGATGSVRLRF